MATKAQIAKLIVELVPGQSQRALEAALTDAQVTALNGSLTDFAGVASDDAIYSAAEALDYAATFDPDEVYTAESGYNTDLTAWIASEIAGLDDVTAIHNALQVAGWTHA